MRLLALLVLVGCQTEPPRTPSPNRGSTQQQIDEIERQIETLEGQLFWLRKQMCTELGRPVPPDPKPERPLKTTADMISACDEGDPRGCFWEADWLERGLYVEDGGTTTHRPKDVAAAIPVFRKSCEAGYDHGCLWLSSALRSQRDDAGQIALAHELFDAGRIELAAEIWPDRSEPSFTTLRETLESRCGAGNGEACVRRGRLECRRDGTCPDSHDPWQVRACFHGAAMGCGLAAHLLDPRAQRTTDAVLRRTCHGTDASECKAVMTALDDSCARGVWSSCYLVANACTHGATMPRPRPGRTYEDGS